MTKLGLVFQDAKAMTLSGNQSIRPRVDLPRITRVDPPQPQSRSAPYHPKISSAKRYCVRWLYDNYGCVILDSRKLFHAYYLRVWICHVISDSRKLYPH